MKALDLAKYVILISYQTGYPVSNLQLQKILYFANLFYMARHKNKKLIDDDFEAWQFGPVIRDVYNRYFINGSNPIYPNSDLKNNPTFENKIETEIDDVAIKNVILNLAQKSAWFLVELSHDTIGAWSKTYKTKGLFAIISDDLIREEIRQRFKNEK